MIATLLGFVYFFGLIIGGILVAGLPIYLPYSRIICSKRSSEYPFPEEYTNKLRTSKEKAVDIFVWFISGIIMIYLVVHLGFGFGTFKGRSYEMYKKRAHNVFYHEELPDSIERFKYRYQFYGLGMTSAAAFTLHGQDYDDFVASLEKKGNGKVIGYTDTDYDYTGLKVAETMNNYDNYNKYFGFPKEGLDYVIDDDISNYTILYYESIYGSHNSIKGIAANQDTGRILIYEHYNN
ncbi:MAG: hypothetical protein J5684_02160 [Eubacterium sp.]|nr:hypothetical protein [Eubacterium sp.]